MNTKKLLFPLALLLGILLFAFLPESASAEVTITLHPKDAQVYEDAKTWTTEATVIGCNEPFEHFWQMYDEETNSWRQFIYTNTKRITLPIKDHDWQGKKLRLEIVTHSGAIFHSDTFSVPVVPLPVVTVEGTYSFDTYGHNGEGTYHPGDVVVLNAGTREGYTFDGWTSNDVAINEANNIHGSFQMPKHNVKVIANWKATIDPNAHKSIDLTLTAPVTGNTPAAATTSAEFCQIIDTNWNPITDTFVGDMVYNATIIVKSLKPHYFTDETTVTVNGKQVTPFSRSSTQMAVKVTFPRTAKEDQKPVTPKNPFVDVFPTDYYYDPVVWAVNTTTPIASGITKTLFKPHYNCTRAQAVTFLWRFAGQPEPSSLQNPFNDVTPSDYSYKAILWAAEEGITSGTGPNTFSPEIICSRGNIVTLLWRLQGSPNVSSKTNFTDVHSNDYYANAVQWAVERYITEGTSPTTFSPNANCTRGQIVTFLYRAK